MHGAMVRNWFKLALELTVGLVGILHSPPKKCKQVQTVCSTSGFAIFLGKHKHTAERRASAGGCSCIIKAEKQKRGETKRQTRRNKQKKQKAKKHDDRNEENKTEF